MTSFEMENVSQDRHMAQLVTGTAQMPKEYQGLGWQTKGIKTYARSADAHTSCWWSLPHTLLVLCHLMLLCGHLWALCCASSQAFGSRNQQGFLSSNQHKG